MVVQAAVGDLRGLEEAPDIRIRPAQDGVYPHEGRPARAAGAELVLPARIRIPSAVQHSSVSETCKALAVMCTHEGCGLPGQFLAQAACIGSALQCTEILHHCMLGDAYREKRRHVNFKAHAALLQADKADSMLQYLLVQVMLQGKPAGDCGRLLVVRRGSTHTSLFPRRLLLCPACAPAPPRRP